MTLWRPSGPFYRRSPMTANSPRSRLCASLTTTSGRSPRPYASRTLNSAKTNHGLMRLSCFPARAWLTPRVRAVMHAPGAPARPPLPPLRLIALQAPVAQLHRMTTGVSRLMFDSTATITLYQACPTNWTKALPQTFVDCEIVTIEW